MAWVCWRWSAHRRLSHQDQNGGRRLGWDNLVIALECSMRLPELGLPSGCPTASFRVGMLADACLFGKGRALRAGLKPRAFAAGATVAQRDIDNARNDQHCNDERRYQQFHGFDDSGCSRPRRMWKVSPLLWRIGKVTTPAGPASRRRAGACRADLVSVRVPKETAPRSSRGAQTTTHGIKFVKLR